MSKALFATSLAAIAAVVIQPSASTAALPVEILRAVAALPAHIAGAFDDIAACHVSPEGEFLVFDRRAHAVTAVTRDAAPRKVIQIGIERGKILRPVAFDSAPDGTFVVADAPSGVERLQIFFYRGGTIGAFALPGRSIPRVALGDLVLSGIGSIDYTGKTILVGQPETGALITEYALDGRTLRSFGALRATGHEQDRDLHAALNAGMPIALADGSFYFVFLSGTPAFRKFDARGTLVFERHIEGPEMDRHIQTLPSEWPRRRTPAGEYPIVPPSVRTAAVDGRGQLWISLVVPYTYVYDAAGDKTRTVQFQAAGTMTPSNMHFMRDGRVLVAPGCYTFNPQ